MGALLTLAACAGDTGPQGEPGATGPAGPQGAAGEAAAPAQIDVADLSYTGCHDDTTLIAGKTTAWAESLHGTGESYVRGSSASCAGCHSGGAFSVMVAAGATPGTVEAGDPEPTRQDCRTCHDVHTATPAPTGRWKPQRRRSSTPLKVQPIDGGCRQPVRHLPPAASRHRRRSGRHDRRHQRPLGSAPRSAERHDARDWQAPAASRQPQLPLHPGRGHLRRLPPG